MLREFLPFCPCSHDAPVRIVGIHNLQEIHRQKVSIICARPLQLRPLIKQAARLLGEDAVDISRRLIEGLQDVVVAVVCGIHVLDFRGHADCQDNIVWRHLKHLPSMP